MRTNLFPFLAFSVFVLLSPLRVSAVSPFVDEVRPVNPVQDAKKFVTVTGGMIWYDADPATRGLRFPEGTYTLEAEDKNYFYFRSAKPLEFRVFKNGKMVDGRDIPGGLMLSKHLFIVIPGAGYIDDIGPNKRMLWKLGANFLDLRGRNWSKSY